MKFLFIVLIQLTSGFAYAGVNEQIATIDKARDACLENQENYSTAAMIQCNSDAFKLADAILNQVYREKTTELRRARDKNSAEILDRLMTAQHAWITYRDANVLLMGTSMLGGSGEGIIRVGTMYQMTKDRVLELNGLFGSL
jgi:uncharacterized protein YecT (DUF1311 family)